VAVGASLIPQSACVGCLVGAMVGAEQLAQWSNTGQSLPFP
jgi:hypothetical protein